MSISAQQIRDRASSMSAEEVASMIGLDLRRRGAVLRGRCPLHDGDGDNFALRDGGAWTCHSRCGSGDLLGLVADLNGLDGRTDFRRVVEITGGLLGLSDVADTGLSIAEIDRLDARRRAREEAKVSRQTETAVVLGAIVARCDLGGKIPTYLYHRGGLVGRRSQYLPASDLGLVEFLPEALRATVKELGEDVVRRVVGPPAIFARDFLAHPLVMPVTNTAGQVVAIQARSINPNCPKSRRYTSRGTSALGFFGGRDLNASEDVLVVVTEGALDCLALRVAEPELTRAWGPFVAVGRAGASGGLSAEQITMLTGRRVLLAFDGDEAGKLGESEATKKLMNNAISVNVLRLPSGQDLNTIARRVAA